MHEEGRREAAFLSETARRRAQFKNFDP